MSNNDLDIREMTIDEELREIKAQFPLLEEAYLEILSLRDSNKKLTKCADGWKELYEKVKGD